MTNLDNEVFEEHERDLIRQAFPPIPVSDASIQATLRRAVEERARQDALRNRARRRRTMTLVAAAAILLLGAGGALWWNANRTKSGPPATLQEALAITGDAAEHGRPRVQSAMLKVYRDLHRLLADSANQESVQQLVRGVVLAALDGPIEPVPYGGGFEGLLQKVQRRETLSTDELDRLAAAARAAVVALRRLGTEQTMHTPAIKVLCTHLRNEAGGTSGEGGGDGSEARDHENDRDGARPPSGS